MHAPSIAVLASLSCAAACAPSAPPVSALLITLDTTRADALGCYGRPGGATPALDALAREGVVFERARTVVPLTLPAHASMLTGLYPPRHGVRDNNLVALPSSARTVAELARQEGVQTAAFVAAAVLDRSFGLDQGFATYGQPPRTSDVPTSGFAELPAEEVVDRALAWLRARDRARPFLLWVHLFDPHHPWQAPPQLLEQAGGDPYLAEVARADRAVGRLLAALRAEGALERTLVVAVADHGEGLGEHGEATHGAFCYDGTLRVPLVLRLPDGARAGERSAATVTVADIAPTLLEGLGLELPPGLDGASLLGPLPQERGVYFESYYGWLRFGWSQLAGWVDAEAKYLHSSRPELYRPQVDPGERVDLAAAPPVPLDAYRARIGEVAARPALAADPPRTVDPRLVAQLGALGYGGAEGAPDELPHPLAASDRPSPASRKAELRAVHEAVALSETGRRDEAVARLRAVLRENPANAFAADQLGYDLLQAGRHQEALDLLLPLVAAGHARASSHVNAARAAEALGRGDEAVALLERALELDAGHAEALRLLMQARARRGEQDAVLRLRERLRALASGAAAPGEAPEEPR